nr:primosomal protein [Janibacter anophelis]
MPMSDPRPALNQLIAAFERHLEASAQRRGEDDPTVVAAYEDLADAFEAYDDALHDATGEMTPLVVVDEQFMVDDDDEDDDDYDDDEDEQSYSGLDDEEYDADDSRR